VVDLQELIVFEGRLWSLYHLLTIVCLSGLMWSRFSKQNFNSSSSSMFEDYFKDIMSPYFEFQKFNSCCRLIHLGGAKF